MHFNKCLYKVVGLHIGNHLPIATKNLAVKDPIRIHSQHAGQRFVAVEYLI